MSDKSDNKPCFNADCKASMQKYFPAYRTIVANNPGHKNTVVGTWLTQTIDKILENEPCWKDEEGGYILDLKDRSVGDYKPHMRRFFQNDSRSSAHKNAVAAVKAEKEGADKKVSSDIVAERLETLLKFSSNMSGRQLFAIQHREVILAKARSLSARPTASHSQTDDMDVDEAEDCQEPATNAQGKYQQALAELWNKEPNKDTYDNEAKKMAKDIFSNQEQLPECLISLFDAMNNSKQLGNVSAFCVLAYRDKENLVRTQRLDYTPFISSHDFSDVCNDVDLKRLDEHWKAFNNELLPRHKKPDDTTSQFEVVNGIPAPRDDIPPTNTSLSQLLDSLFKELWKLSGRSLVDSTLPWDEISANPSQYYDVTMYKFREGLCNPSSYLDSSEELGYLYYLLRRLAKAENAFHFYSPKDMKGAERVEEMNAIESEAEALLLEEQKRIQEEVDRLQAEAEADAEAEARRMEKERQVEEESRRLADEREKATMEKQEQGKRGKGGRGRTSNACLACSNKKIKCTVDAGETCCQHCIKANVACESRSTEVSEPQPSSLQGRTTRSNAAAIKATGAGSRKRKTTNQSSDSEDQRPKRRRR